MSYGKRITWLTDRQKYKYTCSHKGNRIVLFDMDGTLTPPRMQFDKQLLNPLRNLSKHSQIGILTGSDIDYVKQQMSYVLRHSELIYCMHLLPCNGTKWYPPPHNMDDSYYIKHSVNMRETLGEEKFRSLMAILLDLQSHAAVLSFPLAGEFVQYRGSMINWCPIGRSATSEDRKKFISYDSKSNFRYNYLKRLERKLSLVGLDKYITCALGGDTSFDIYPTGWDKTYALTHFQDMDVWFVGDRCRENGNDQQIYEKLKPKARSFETTCVEQTEEIIKNLISIMSSEEEKNNGG